MEMDAQLKRRAIGATWLSLHNANMRLINVLFRLSSRFFLCHLRPSSGRMLAQAASYFDEKMTHAWRHLRSR
jgi:hypothetical protein